MSQQAELIGDTISKDVKEVDSTLREKDRVREEVIKLTREITRLSSSVVSSVHREDYTLARKYVEALRDIVSKLLQLVESHPDLKYSGLVYNGLSEYVEAVLFYSIVAESRVLSLSELGVPFVPYLQGLGDLVGEFRRLVVRLLDKLDIVRAEHYFGIMEVIYENLRILVDYPDALIPGIRHKVDVAARLIEDTRILILNTKNSLRCINQQFGTK